MSLIKSRLGSAFLPRHPLINLRFGELAALILSYFSTIVCQKAVRAGTSMCIVRPGSMACAGYVGPTPSLYPADLQIEKLII